MMADWQEFAIGAVIYKRRGDRTCGGEAVIMTTISHKHV